MTFRYEKNGRRSVDDVTGAVILLSGRYPDTSDVPLCYESGDLRFDIHINEVKERRVYLSKDGEAVEGIVAVVVEVVESDIKKAFRAVMNTTKFLNYEAFLQHVVEGIFELETSGGEYLKYSPDLKVRLISRGPR